jgi:hypothetical protein
MKVSCVPEKGGFELERNPIKFRIGTSENIHMWLDCWHSESDEIFYACALPTALEIPKKKKKNVLLTCKKIYSILMD